MGHQIKFGYYKDKPRWIGTTDVLSFAVEEFCNYYDDPECDHKKVLATYQVHLDTASLKIQSQPIVVSSEKTGLRSDSRPSTESADSIKDFERVLERVPPKNYTVIIHQDLKPVLISIFGGAELVSHFDRSNFSGLVYTLKRQIRSTDQMAIKKMLETKGYKYEFTKGSPGLEAFFFRKKIGGKVYGIKLGLGLRDEGASVRISDSWSQLLAW